jgi:hypothetical protein
VTEQIGHPAADPSFGASPVVSNDKTHGRSVSTAPIVPVRRRQIALGLTPLDEQDVLIVIRDGGICKFSGIFTGKEDLDDMPVIYHGSAVDTKGTECIPFYEGAVRPRLLTDGGPWVRMGGISPPSDGRLP